MGYVRVTRILRPCACGGAIGYGSCLEKETLKTVGYFMQCTKCRVKSADVLIASDGEIAAQDKAIELWEVRVHD